MPEVQEKKETFVTFTECRKEGTYGEFVWKRLQVRSTDRQAACRTAVSYWRQQGYETNVSNLAGEDT